MGDDGLRHGAVSGRGRRGALTVWTARLALAALVLCGGFFLTERAAERLVGLPEHGAAPAEYSWRVAAIMPTSDDGYWREMRLGMREAARRYHVGLEFLGPRYPNPDRTAQRFEQAIAARVDGIICHAEDTPDMAAIISRARDAAIPVIAMGVDVPGSGRRGYVGPDPYYLGFEVGRTLRQAVKKGEIAAVLNRAPGRPGNAGDRYLSGLRRSIAAVPGLHLARVDYLPPSAALAEQGAARLLAGDPPYDAICCASPRDTLAVARVLRDRDLDHEVRLVGAGLLPEILQLLRQRALLATVASYPFAMGYDAVRLLADNLAGRTHPDEINSGVQVFWPEDAESLLRDYGAGGGT
ncbi:MAG: sugar ABC transporter substrate-binding protein [Patescibacteria group bacterium]